MYDFCPVEVTKFLRSHGVKRVGIQLPPGLKRYLPELEAPFRSAGVEAVLLMGSCYGACDLADDQAKRLGCDALVHYGHSDMGIRASIPTLFVEARMNLSPLKLLERVLPELGFESVGLVATVQHVGFLEEVKRWLDAQGLRAEVGAPGFRARYPGQILGCDWGAAKSIRDRVEGYLYLGTGEFHPLGVSLATGKRVMALNPLAEGWKALEPPKDFLAKRKALISRAAGLTELGVVVSVKPGQARLKLARGLVEELEASGFKARLVALDEITPEKLEDLGLEAYVCTACPTIPLYDAPRFKQPLLTPFEARVLMGKASLEPYELDEVQPGDFG